MMRASIVLIVAFSFFADPDAFGQNTRPRGVNNANPNDVAVSYGNTKVLPRNYDAYYSSQFNGYQLSPFLTNRPGRYIPRAAGKVQPYSDVEYGRLVLSALDAGSIEPSGSRTAGTQSIVEETTDSIMGSKLYKSIETNIVDVIDRGILVVPTREDVRLRGVRVGSEKSTNEVERLYAKEAIQMIRNLTQGKQVYLIFDNPIRDADGVILATVFLEDGTELNRLMVDRGYGQVQADDFTANVNFEDLITAENGARNQKIGLWSRPLTPSQRR